MKKRQLIFVLIIHILILSLYRFDIAAAMTDPPPEAKCASGTECNPDIESGQIPDLVSTGPELIEWMDAHRNTGGSVKLTDHIVLDGSYSFATDVVTKAAISIDTGQYTVTVAGNIELFSNYHLTFFGDAGDKGIFHIVEGGFLSLSGVTVDNGQCALWQDEGAGLALDNCRVSGSVHYADTPYVIYAFSVCAIVEDGQTAGDVLPTVIKCDVNHQGRVEHNVQLPVSWMLEGTEKQQRERLRFQVQGSFLNAVSGELPVCTVVYNDYPLTFAEVQAYKNEYEYMFRGWYIKPEEALPMFLVTEYSFDETNWFVDDIHIVSTTDSGFFIGIAKEQWDTVRYPYVYIRLQWRDHETRYYSNVLRFAADNLETAEDQGGSRGGGTSIINPPDQPEDNVKPDHGGSSGGTDSSSDTETPDPTPPQTQENGSGPGGADNTGSENGNTDNSNQTSPETGNAYHTGSNSPETGGADQTSPGAAETGSADQTSPGAADAGSADQTSPGGADTGSTDQTSPGGADTGSADQTGPKAADTGSAGSGIPGTDSADAAGSKAAGTGSTVLSGLDTANTGSADSDSPQAAAAGTTGPETDGTSGSDPGIPESEGPDNAGPKAQDAASPDAGSSVTEMAGSSISAADSSLSNPKKTAAEYSKGIAIAIGLAALSVGAGLTGFCVHAGIFRKMFLEVKRRLVR